MAANFRRWFLLLLLFTCVGVAQERKQISELDPLSAQHITDDDAVLFGVDKTDVPKSYRLSLAELKSMGVEVINVRQCGAVGDGVTDDTAAIQAALDLGDTIYIPDGTFLVSETLVVTQTNNARIFGNGNLSILKSGITDGTAVLDLNDAQHITLQSFKIQGAGDTSTSNFIGIEFGGANRWSLIDMTVFNAATGVKMDTAHIGTIHNLFIRYSTLALQATTLNDVRGSIHIENTSQGFTITGANNCSISVLVEGAHRTTTSTIDNVHASSFDFYFEDSDAATIAEVTIGGTTHCTNNQIHCSSSHTTGTSVPIFALDRVKGMRITGSTILNGFYQFITTTSNSVGVQIDVRDLTTATAYPVPVPGISSFRYPVNYFPDPFFHTALPTPRTDSQAVSSEETSIVLPFCTRSLKVTATTGQTLCYTNVNLTLAKYPYLAELLGKTIGVGYWVYVPSNYTYTNNTVGADLFVRANGTGTPVTATRSTVWNKGTWLFATNEVAVPTDTTSFDIRYHAVRSAAGAADSNTIAYFTGPVIWIGGLSQAADVMNGRICDHPAAGMPALKNIMSGAGSPEGAVTAPVGHLYLRTDGGTSTTLYIKQSGTGNTGWVAK